MFKKLLATVLVFTMFSSKTFAGDYIHGVGVGYDVSVGLGAVGGGPSVQYLGRFNYLDFSDGNMSLGVSFTPFVGYNTGVLGGGGLMFGISASPVEFSFGPAATKDADSKIGFAIAPIYNLTHVLVTGASPNHQIGANLAFRFAAGDHPMSVNVNYLSALTTGGGGGVGFRYAFYF